MSRYKNELEEIFAREDAFRQKIWKPLILAGVVATTVFALSVSFAGNIIAGGADTSVVEILKVDQEDIDQAKQDRDEAEAQAAEALCPASSQHLTKPMKSRRPSTSSSAHSLKLHLKPRLRHWMTISRQKRTLKPSSSSSPSASQRCSNTRTSQLSRCCSNQIT